MAVTDEIKILIETEVDKSLKNIKRLKKAENTVSDKSLVDRIKNNWLKIAAGIGVVIVGIKKAFDFSKEAAKFEQAMSAAEKQFGKSGDNILRKLREVSQGTVSNADLIESANRAMALNVTTDLDKMAKLLEIARVRARSMGIDTTQAFNDIVTGIGRQSPLILDNLGIITKGWLDEAKSAGVAGDAQFFLNKVLEDGNKILEKTGPLVLSDAEKIQKFGANIDNLVLKIGMKLKPAIVSATDSFDEFLTTDKIKSIAMVFGELVARVILGTKVIVNTFSSWIDVIATVSRAVKDFGTLSSDQWEFIIKDTKAQISGINNFRKLKNDQAVDAFLLAMEKMKTGSTETKDALISNITEVGEKNIEIFKNMQEAVAFWIGFTKEALAGINSVYSQFHANRISEIDNRKIEGINALQEELDAGLISQEEFEERKKKLEKDSAITSAKAKRKQFFDEQGLKVAQIGMDLASAIMNIWSKWAANPIVAGSLTGVVTGIAGVQTGLVLSQEPPSIPAFAKGGSFITSGPGLFLAGEAGPERVDVTPLSNVTNNNNAQTTINLQTNDPIEFVNTLKRNYGIDVFS